MTAQWEKFDRMYKAEIGEGKGVAYKIARWSFTRGREQGIEECAKVAETCGQEFQCTDSGYELMKLNRERVAKAIRALKGEGK